MTEQTTTISELVEQAVKDGILQPTNPMNGTGTDYVSVGTADEVGTHDVLIGKLSKAQYGVPARVYVSVRIAHMQGRESETTDHRTVSDYWSLSISGATTTAQSRRDDDIDAGGQCRDLVAMAADAPASLPEFVKVWDAYHLTGMQAGCDHQSVIWEDKPYRRPSLELTLPCPVTGYRYGHAWLVRDLPTEAVATVLAFLRAAKGL